MEEGGREGEGERGREGRRGRGEEEVGRRWGGGGGERGEEGGGGEEENDERMVGEVEVRCVGSGMQGVSVEACVHLCWCCSATQKRFARLGAVSAERLTCPCGVVGVLQRLLRL